MKLTGSVTKTVENPDSYTLGNKYFIDNEWRLCIVIDHNERKVTFV